jgi:hypothetical protein
MTAEANDNSGLLDSALAEEEQTTESQEQSISHTTPDPSAEDDTPLERPDFWPEKFWKKDSNEPDLEGLSKSYAELEKQFRAGKHKVPTDGKYSFEALQGIPEDDPVAQAYVGWASKYGISQQAFDDLASQIVTMSAGEQQAAETSIKREREALGPNADAIIKNMAAWGRGMLQKGVWGPEEFEGFKETTTTARGIRAWLKARESFEGRVPVQAAPVEDAPSKEELDSMVGDKRYKTDPAFRAKVEKMFEKMYG